MRNAEYPDVDGNTPEGEKAIKDFRSAFTMTNARDSFETLMAVDTMLKRFGLEVVNLGDGSDPLFRIDKISQKWNATNH